MTLRPKEYDLLVALLQRRGQVASRAELLEEVWGYSGEVYSRTVDTHVAELRRKLEENAGEPQHILTVRKTGYRIEFRIGVTAVAERRRTGCSAPTTPRARSVPTRNEPDRT